MKVQSRTHTAVSRTASVQAANKSAGKSKASKPAASKVTTSKTTANKTTTSSKAATSSRPAANRTVSGRTNPKPVSKTAVSRTPKETAPPKTQRSSGQTGSGAGAIRSAGALRTNHVSQLLASAKKTVNRSSPQPVRTSVTRSSGPSGSGKNRTQVTVTASVRRSVAKTGPDVEILAKAPARNPKPAMDPRPLSKGMARNLSGDMPETAKKRFNKTIGERLDELQESLDTAGMVPGAGDTCDVLNTLISVGRGKYRDAALSAAAVIPVLGSAVPAAKEIRRAEHAVEQAGDVIKAADRAGDALKAERALEGAEKAAGQLGKEGRQVKKLEQAQGVAKSVGKSDNRGIKGGFNTKIDNITKQAREWLGEDVRVVTNKNGDKVFMSNDATKRVRFDINNTSPHNNPHGHVEEFINGKWIKSGPIYPTDVPHN